MTKASLRHTIKHRDILGLFRSSHRSCSVEKGALKDSANFTGKHLCWSLFLITLQVFKAATLLKVYSYLDVFLWNLWNFLRTLILQNIWERLLLFVSPQNNITNSGGEFGLDETSTECNVSIFLSITILFNHGVINPWFNQMQPYNLHVS